MSLRTPEEKAAALEELKATARARVRAEVEAKLADLRARNILSAGDAEHDSRIDADRRQCVQAGIDARRHC